MKFTETKLKGAFVIEINQIMDERGFFGRSWCRREMEEYGLNSNLAQANTSFSKSKGTIRGLHFQMHPYEETKLIRCTKGAIYDVIIDLRKDSPTYMQWYGEELTEENYKMMYIPENFAHGFLTLTDNAEVYYLVTSFYTPHSEGGIRFDDPAFNINWPIPVKIVSDKDRSHPDFNPENLFTVDVLKNTTANSNGQ